MKPFTPATTPRSAEYFSPRNSSAQCRKLALDFSLLENCTVELSYEHNKCQQIPCCDNDINNMQGFLMVPTLQLHRYFDEVCHVTFNTVDTGWFLLVAQLELSMAVSFLFLDRCPKLHV